MSPVRVRSPASTSDSFATLSDMKTTERLEARQLREHEGLSMKQIASIVGVSLSSVSLWVRDIELDAVKNASMRSRAARRRGEARAAHARALRRDAQERGRERAARGDPLHLAGCMLFWAEGDKHRNGVRLSNSDPDLLRLFVNFLRDCYEAEIARIAVTCYLFADHLERQLEVEDYWLRALGLPESCLRRSIVNVYSKYSQKKRCNKLPYGTCKVAYNDTRTVQSIYGAIQEYGGFDRPAWLG
jgi:transcriptional regulator with XRE-family HTH domain